MKSELAKTKKMLKEVQASVQDKDRLLKQANEEKTKVEGKVKDLESTVKSHNQKSHLLKE